MPFINYIKKFEALLRCFRKVKVKDFHCRVIFRTLSSRRELNCMDGLRPAEKGGRHLIIFSQTRDINTFHFTHVKPVQFTPCTYVQGKKNPIFWKYRVKIENRVFFIWELCAHIAEGMLIRAMFYRGVDDRSLWDSGPYISRILLWLGDGGAWYGKGTISCALQARAYLQVMNQKQRRGI